MIDVLIPTIPERSAMFKRLITKLEIISKGYPVNIIHLLDDKTMTIGEKRNALLSSAKSKYTMFVDDDDDLARDAFKQIFKAIEYKPDCVELKGLLTVNNANPKEFIHSIDYKTYFERDNVYYRPPNHLNPIRREIAQQFSFPEKNFAEDTDWAMKIAGSGALSTMGRVDGIWYFYNWRSGVSTTGS